MKTSLFVVVFVFAIAVSQVYGDISVELTNENEQFSNKDSGNFAKDNMPSNPNVVIDEVKQFQTIEGFGAALTESSAYVLHNLDNDKYWDTLNKLFNPETGLGVSYLRLTISASDFSLGDYSYDDVSNWGYDPDLNDFSVAHDENFMIPVLKDIKSINPNMKIVATPWTPPAWMKDQYDSRGSVNGQENHLQQQYYESYANFFVKTVQAYQAHGITLDTVTIQNEPLYGPAGYPGMKMESNEQSDFLNNHLAPAFINNNIQTKVLVYDHNWDNEWYPDQVLGWMNDQAKQVVGGAAFHCYGGDVSAQSTLHDKYPDMPIYLTECSGGGWESGGFGDWLVGDMQRLFIGATNNWARASIKWNLVLDQNAGPQNGGCANCRPMITVNTDNGDITETSDYYSIGLFSRYVKQGAIRINSWSEDGSLEVAAFINPDQSRVAIVVNSDWSDHTFNLNWNYNWAAFTIPGRTVGAYKWSQ